MENLGSKYLAFVLDEASRNRILSHFPPKFERVICHHITVQFQVTEELYQKYTAELGNADLSVVGYACDDSLECLVVSVNGNSKREDGSFYHITLSLNPPRKPVDSNKLLMSGVAIQQVSIPIWANLTLVNK